jgi:hypothetical protein
MVETLRSEGGPSFRYHVQYELHIESYRCVVLSVPALDQSEKLQSKNLLRPGQCADAGKYTLEEHLRFLDARGAVPPEQPLLVLGLRNNLVNPRAPVIYNGRAFAVAPEAPERSRRSYYGLGSRNGRLLLDTALGPDSHPQDWLEFFCAGIPVLWDACDNDTLFDLMLSEASDHSHVFHLPRGNHPKATDESRTAWQRLHRVFMEHLDADRQTIVAAMRRELAQFCPPLRRCDDYFHAVIGESGGGNLVGLFAHGRLESLGRLAAARGCHRAVCVENSGSIMPTFLPRGLRGDMIPLLRAPNFRPRGRAVLVFELSHNQFDSFTPSGVL